MTDTDDNTKLNIRGEAAAAFEPDAEVLTHVTSADSYAARLRDAEQDYADAREAFFSTDPNTEAIMAAAAEAEMAAKALISRALVIFHMNRASREEKELAMEILRRMSEESNIREQTCSRFYRKTRMEKPENKGWLRRLFREKIKRMNFLDRCMRTQSVYTRMLMKGNTLSQREIEIETAASEKAARTRRCLPEGAVFRPPRIFPHDPIPYDQPVPLAPEVYRRFKAMLPEELDFDAEHQIFVLPKNYRSSDGKMDSESIVWDHEQRKVTMKFAGEDPVTWDFKQYKDPAEVTDPDDWCVQYHRRLFLQEAMKEECFQVSGIRGDPD